MIQRTEPATSNRRLRGRGENLASSIICCQDGGCEVEYSQIASVSALLGLHNCISRESFLAVSTFAGTNRHTTHTTKTRDQALPAWFKSRRALKITRNSCQIGEDRKDVDI
jgi:hypothetical protein